MTPKTMLPVTELTAKTKGDKNLLLALLLKSIYKSIKNKENWIIITAQCIILIILDLALISLLICVIYPNSIQDPIPYPIITVKVNIIISVSSVWQNLTCHQ